MVTRPTPTLHLVKLDWPGQSLHLHHLHVVHQTVAVLPRGLGVAVKGGHHDLDNIYILLILYNIDIELYNLLALV